MKKIVTALALIIITVALIWLVRVVRSTTKVPTTASVTSPRVSPAGPGPNQTLQTPVPPAALGGDKRATSPTEAKPPRRAAADAVLPPVTKPPERAAAEQNPPPIGGEPQPQQAPTPVTPVQPGRAAIAPAGEPAPEPEARSSPATPAAAPPDAAPARPAISSSEVELASVQRVLERYKQMYDQLDAKAAAAIWPTVDSRALTRIFARLERQELNFNNCVLALSESRATAQCTGWLSYVPRVGNATSRREYHSWTIEFEHAGGEWQILQVGAH